MGKALEMKSDSDIFQNLFVLEMANNHWGDVTRGKKIIRDFGWVVRQNSVRAAIKLQIRDVDNFIHPDFSGRQDIRYINKTEATKLSRNQFFELASEIRKIGCIPMATPFDEMSVGMCIDLDFPIIKVASSDINDWPLLEVIAKTKKPTIISTGGASESNIDQVVEFFEKRSIPLAINHCVSLYPSEDSSLELNQITYLRKRYPGHVIGFSSHEYNSWDASMYLSYALGARSWERHIDIDYQSVPVSKYCSLPENIDTWLKSFNKAIEMSGGSENSRRVISSGEIKYLDDLVRGVYAKVSVPEGTKINHYNFSDYFFTAIPLLKGQVSVREVLEDTVVHKNISKNQPLMIDDISGVFTENERLKNLILNRGFSNKSE
jgi:N-acetylneuraminate synthase